MGEKPALAWNPVSFTSNKGNHLAIPLSALYFDDAGQLQAERWPLYADNQTRVDQYLERLVRAKIIQPGPEPTAKSAFTATAVTPGKTGVDLEIAITNVTPNADTPPASTADVEVNETNIYSGIVLEEMASILGSAPDNGLRPGLVYLSSSEEPALPQAGGPYPLAKDDPAQPAQAEIPRHGGGDPAFSLTARSDNDDGALTQVEIGDVVPGDNTFTLKVTWSKSVTAAAVSDLAESFAYVVTIEPPEGGYRAPVQGKVALAGGSDAVAVSANRASAAVLSSQ